MIDYGYGVSLLPLNPAHLDFYRQNRNNPKIRRWCRQWSLIDQYQQQAWFEHVAADASIVMFEISSKGPVGVCGLTDINYVNRRAEFSLYVNPDSQGSGIGLKALKTLCRYGFDDVNLNLIWGETVGQNPAESMFKKAGFICTGYRPDFYFKEGKFHASNIYCIDSVTFANKWRPLSIVTEKK